MPRTVVRLRACGLLLIGGCLTGRGAPAQAPVPLPIETVLAQPTFPPYAPLVLSPDGAWVAYALRYPARAHQATVNSWFTPTGTPSIAKGERLWITEVGTGRTLPVGDAAATSWGAAWSPDGRHLAYYSDADGTERLWVRETATGRTRRASDAITRAHRAFALPRWTPDSRSVVVPILPSGSPLPEAAHASDSSGTNATRETDSATVTVMRADPAQRYGGQFSGGRSMNNLTSLRADLALVDVMTGAVATLAHGYQPLEYEVAPTGRFVVFTSEKAATIRARWTVPYDLMVVPLGVPTPTPRAVAAAAPLSYTAKSVLWSPDGATLLYSMTDSAGRTQFVAADSGTWRSRRVGVSGPASLESDSSSNFWQAMRWDRDGGRFYALTLHGVAIVSMPDGVVRSLFRAPAGYETLAMLGPQSQVTAHSENGRSLIVAIRNDSTKRMGFARVDLTTGAWRILVDDDRHFGERYHLPMDVASDGRVVYLSEDGQHPTDIWTAGPGFAAPRQLTHVAPKIEQVALGRARLIDFTTATGSPRRGTLLLPVGYRPGQRYPLVVYPYPLQLRSNDVNTFGVTGTGVENMQLLATRGFAVLAPDVPPFDWKDHLRDLTSIIQRGVDRVIELGIADSTRLGIIGHSWGGYTTLAMITQTDRFGAAVMRGGYGDLTTTTASLQAGGYANGLMLEEMTLGGTPWEQPDLYRRNSPIYQLDRVHTPLLIIHGEGETTVPIFQADQVFAGLQRLGRNVEFARYANENHFEGTWTYANQRDYLRRMIGWFGSHLSARSSGRDAGAARPDGRERRAGS